MIKLSRILMMLILGVAGLYADSVREGFYLDQNVQAAYNPLGFQLGTKFFYRFPLVKENGILWESTKIDVGLVNNFSPAYDFAGGFIDIQPIAFFDIALSAQAEGYYDALGYGFYDLSGYNAAFDNSALKALHSKSTGGYFLSAAPTLKFALGPIAALDTFNINYFNVDGGRGYFYETINNCILAKSGTELLNQAYLLVKVGPDLMIGLNDTLLHIPASGYESQTVHAIGVFTTKLDEKLTFYSALMLGTYLTDRYLRYEVHGAGEVGITLAL